MACFRYQSLKSNISCTLCIKAFPALHQHALNFCLPFHRKENKARLCAHKKLEFSSSPELLLLNKAFRIAFVESLREKSGKSMRGNVSQQTWTNISIVYFSQMGATEQDVKRASQAESYVNSHKTSQLANINNFPNASLPTT